MWADWPCDASGFVIDMEVEAGKTCGLWSLDIVRGRCGSYTFRAQLWCICISTVEQIAANERVK